MEIAVNILPNIWIGNSLSSQNEKLFNSQKITSVLNLSPTLPNFFVYDTLIEYMRIPISDKTTDKDNLINYLPVITHFIYKNVILQGKNILVHSDTSNTIACTVIAAYLMKFYDKSLDESILFIKTRKPDMNVGEYMNVLNEW